MEDAWVVYPLYNIRIYSDPASLVGGKMLPKEGGMGSKSENSMNESHASTIH